jgi:hypothetical protein
MPLLEDNYFIPNIGCTNFSFQGFASSCVGGVPMFQQILQLPPCLWNGKGNPYIDLAMGAE